MVPDVVGVLARLAERELWVGEGELWCFPARPVAISTAPRCGDASSRPARADLRPIRFHDLRHTFGTLAVLGAESIVELQAWLGHAEVRTTMRYTHYREQADAAARLSRAFQVAAPPADRAPNETSA